jgi:FimV-like protein
MPSITRQIVFLTLFVGGFAAAQTWSDAELAGRFSVSGVLVSADNRIALINDRLTRVGEEIGGARVVAIESNRVHLRLAEQTFAMRVGSSVIRDSDYAVERVTPQATPEEQLVQLSPSVPARLPLQQTHAAQLSTHVAAHSIPEFPPEYAPDALAIPQHYGPVAPGETLSEIAATLASRPAQRASLMTALFESNPQAFGDSIDVLYAGARLSLPGPAAVHHSADVTGAAARQHPRMADATASPSGVYGPVPRGDTLSELAVRLEIDGITLNQRMLAIYEANPDSFGGNLNVLYAGAMLRIPESAAWDRHSPEAALVEVVRQASVWAAARPYDST